MEKEADRLPDALVEGIEEFLDHLAADRGASPHTVLAYRNDLTLAAPLFGQPVTPHQQMRNRIDKPNNGRTRHAEDSQRPERFSKPIPRFI